MAKKPSVEKAVNAGIEILILRKRIASLSKIFNENVTDLQFSCPSEPMCECDPSLIGLPTHFVTITKEFVPHGHHGERYLEINCQSGDVSLHFITGGYKELFETVLDKLKGLKKRLNEEGFYEG